MAAPKGIAWDKLKKEYITGAISQEALAKKHGIAVRTVVDRSRKEHWFDKRKEWRRKVSEKSIEREAEEAARKDTRIYDITNRLIDKIAEAAEDIDPTDVQAFRALTIALKDIKDIRGDKSERDIAEQEARIAKLRADTKKAEEDKAGAAAVEIIGLPEDYKG